MKNLSVLILSSIFAIASTASANVFTCHILKTTKNLQDGSQTTSKCSVKIDSSDFSGSKGSGGITDALGSLGTLSTNCQDLPVSYTANGKVVPVQVFKQGTETDVATAIQFFTELGYDKAGDLGFNLNQIARLDWAAGGEDTLVYLYTAYDSNGKKLGNIFYPGGSFKFSFQGCYTE